MKNTSLCAFCAGLVLCMGCSGGTQKPLFTAHNAPFSLAVVPTKSFPDVPSVGFHREDDGEITMAQDSPREFYVVLTNITRKTEPVWEYWNSWGYRTISLEFTTQDGQKFIVSKRPQGFTKNFPSTFLVAPGEHQVYGIRLDHEWETHPTLRKSEAVPVKLKAVYEVSASSEAHQHGVWSGRVESKMYNFTLRQLESGGLRPEFEKYDETLSPDKLVARCCTPKLISHSTRELDKVRMRPNEKWSGSPVVSYEILESGVVASLSLKKSSGVADADKFALNWVRSMKYNSRPGCGTLQGQVDVTIDWR